MECFNLLIIDNMNYKKFVIKNFNKDNKFPNLNIEKDFSMVVRCDRCNNDTMADNDKMLYKNKKVLTGFNVFGRVTKYKKKVRCEICKEFIVIKNLNQKRCEKCGYRDRNIKRKAGLETSTTKKTKRTKRKFNIG